MFNLDNNEIAFTTWSAGGTDTAVITDIVRHEYATTFQDQIDKMHGMYELPMHDYPTLQDVRHGDFQHILQKEMEESYDISKKLYDLDALLANTATPAEIEATKNEILTDYADWLTDIIVYCASEARRLGIDLYVTKDVVMQSNFTKLGADGKPIKDEFGKVQKGPNFKKPEPTLSLLIAKARAHAKECGGQSDV